MSTRILALLVASIAAGCGGGTERPVMAERYVIETPGASATAIVRLDAPAPRIPLSGAPRQLQWNATHLFFVSGNAVMRVARDGKTAPESLATGQMLGDLVLAGDRLVWAEPSTRGMDGGSGPGRAGRVSVLSVAGGAPTVLVGDLDPRSLAALDGTLYFSNGDAIERIGLDGADRRRLVEHTGTTPLLRAEGGALYFTRQGGVSRIDAAGRIEPIANDIEIPIGLGLHRGDAVILANAVINRPRPEYARPARLLRVTPGGATRVLWSKDDLLVADLDVRAGRARFTWRPIGSFEPTVIEIPLD